MPESHLQDPTVTIGDAELLKFICDASEELPEPVELDQDDRPRTFSEASRPSPAEAIADVTWAALRASERRNTSVRPVRYTKREAATLGKIAEAALVGPNPEWYAPAAELLGKLAIPKAA